MEESAMADGDCHSELLKAHDAAAELYQLAALMLGDELQAAELVEATVAQAYIDPCAETEASVKLAAQSLVETAVARLSEADPKAFVAPVISTGTNSGCIEEDDLSSAGISSGRFAEMVGGPERRTLRTWLNSLPVAQRAIFVERAILGWDNTAAAASLSRAASHLWQPKQVSELFRMALCSLTTSLIHTATAQV